jgi:hypothetical protein
MRSGFGSGREMLLDGWQSLVVPGCPLLACDGLKSKCQELQAPKKVLGLHGFLRNFPAWWCCHARLGACLGFLQWPY